MADQELSFDGRRKVVEDAFFLKQDQKLIEELKALRQMKETKENLSKVSGIRNDAVLQKLVDLKVHPETVATLSLVPLVAVAWADGEVDEKERKAILSGAKKAGFVSDGVDHVLLERWLSNRPAPKLLQAWTMYVKGLCEQLDSAERMALKDEVMSHARTVADASGSFLGITSGISEDEQQMLNNLDAAFSA